MNVGSALARSGLELGRAFVLLDDFFTMMTVSEVKSILRLRLIVCRAAQADSLQWWDDRSLTIEGAFVVERLFGKRPRVIAAKIALAAARTRHWAAMPKSTNVAHLFDLGDEIEEEIGAVPLEEHWIPTQPFASVNDFALAIKRIVADDITWKQDQPNQDGAFEVRLSARSTKGVDSTLALARVLALAYAGARQRQPVFPFLKV